MGRINKNNRWEVSVTELLEIFRGALLSLIPWLEKANIKWQDTETYDDWDNIVSSLYNNIVCSSLNGNVEPDYLIAKYDFHYSTYSEVDFIQVISNDTFGKKNIFIAFCSKVSPLDSVQVAEIDEFYSVRGYNTLNYNDLEFVFVKNINRDRKLFNKIEVML